MSLTVIMPAYNEEGSIRAAAAEVETEILSKVPGSKLLVVNDGSRDRTKEILDEICAKNPRFTAIHQPNGGHGAALMTGLNHADTEWVMLLDSDRQIPLQGFEKFWSETRSADAIFGVRLERKDAKIRILLTRVIRLVLSILFFAWIKDANVPYKLVKKSVWLDASAYIPKGTLAPSLFLGIYVYVKAIPLKLIPVEHKDRETGEVSIKEWKLLKFCYKAFLQLLQFSGKLGA